MSIEVILDPGHANSLITLEMRKEAGQLLKCGFQSQDEAFFRRGYCVSVLIGWNRRCVRTVDEQVEGNGCDWFIGKRQLFYLIHELDPLVRHPDLQGRILGIQIIAYCSCRKRRETLADIPSRQDEPRLKAIIHATNRKEPARQRPGVINAAPFLRPEWAGRVPRQHDQRKSVCPVRIEDIEQVLIAHVAFAADERELVGIEDDRSARLAAVRIAAADTARQLQQIGFRKHCRIRAGDLNDR